ncbi:MAG: DUF2892 domain-containing protein [Alphaproteobacteria bacterium]|nr:DUF2892 domain-containing protein [Alphaproteobacteria bacterium]
MTIKKNVGGMDRAVRLVAAGLLFLAAAGGAFTAGLSWIFGVAAAILGLSAAFSYCPAYRLMGKSTACGAGMCCPGKKKEGSCGKSEG